MPPGPPPEVERPPIAKTHEFYEVESSPEKVKLDWCVCGCGGLGRGARSVHLYRIFGLGA